jgi:hypothetical protein
VHRRIERQHLNRRILIGNTFTLERFTEQRCCADYFPGARERLTSNRIRT